MKPPTRNAIYAKLSFVVVFPTKVERGSINFYEIFDELTNNNLIGTVTPFKCETETERKIKRE